MTPRGKEVLPPRDVPPRDGFPLSPGRVAAVVVRGYQLLVRPVLPAACRFAPSCSEYTRQALSAHGLLRGGLLSLRRLGRCHPWNTGGYDPPPSAEQPRG